MEFNDVYKFASIRTAIYNVNVRSEPRPTRHIPHFTQDTYKLIEQLRSKKPEFVDGEIKVNRLLKENSTYFTDQEEEDYYYELDQFFNWMQEQKDKEKDEEKDGYCSNK